MIFNNKYQKLSRQYIGININITIYLNTFYQNWIWKYEVKGYISHKTIPPTPQSQSTQWFHYMPDYIQSWIYYQMHENMFVMVIISKSGLYKYIEVVTKDFMAQINSQLVYRNVWFYCWLQYVEGFIWNPMSTLENRLEMRNIVPENRVYDGRRRYRILLVFFFQCVP